MNYYDGLIVISGTHYPTRDPLDILLVMQSCQPCLALSCIYPFDCNNLQVYLRVS